MSKVNWILQAKYMIGENFIVTKSYDWKDSMIKESVKESYTASISVMHTVFQSFANIRMPKLSIEEMREGCKLGIDTCAGRHAHVLKFIEGKYVTAKGFTKELPEISNLPIVNVLYAYDAPNGEVILLRVKNAIYLGKGMEDSLLQPDQCRESEIEIDTRPKCFCPNDESAETIRCPESDRTLPVRHHSPLPYIPTSRPTANEILTCEVIELTSTNDWDPYDPNSAMTSILSKVKTNRFKKKYWLCPRYVQFQQNS